MRRLLSILVNRAVLSALVVVATVAPARADAVHIAVVPSIAVNLDTAKVDALCQDLAAALSSELVVEASGGLEVRRKLPADGLPPDCATNAACAADVAKRLGATQLLFVVMVDSGGGSVQVDATWVEPSSGRSAARPAVDLTSIAGADAKSVFASAARALLPDAPARGKKSSAPTLVNAAGVPRHLSLAAKITAGAAGATLITGIVLGLETRSKYNACVGDPSCAAMTGGKKDTIRALGLGADASFIAAAGCTIATAMLYATSGQAPHVIVAPSAEGATVSFVGTFP
jgi:hypothetical protein